MLPVPLEELYVSWVILPSTRKRFRAFVAAVQRNSADSIIRTLTRAGLTPYLMDIKPLALARLVNETSAVIVDVQAREYDIAIIGDGVPQPIRSIPIPTEGLSWPEKQAIIMDDLVRTMEFFNANNPENPFAPDMPIYVSGELANEAEVCRSISNQLERPVLPLLLPFRHPHEMRQDYYAVNAGLALKVVSPRGKLISPLAKLDTLPPAYQPKSFSLTRVLTLSSVIAVLSLAIPLIALIQIGSSNISEARAQLETMTADLERKVEQQRELTIALKRTAFDLNAFIVALEMLDGQREGYNATLQEATDLLPESVALCEINHDSSTITLQVDSLVETTVLDYGRSLENSGSFSEVTVSRMNRLECGTLRFMLILRVKE